MLVICCVATLVSCNRQTVDLKLNLPEGKTFDYAFDYEIIQKAEGRDVTTNLAMAYTVEVMPSPGLSRTMKATYNRVAMKIQTADQTMEIDTDQPTLRYDSTSTNPMHVFALAFQRLIGNSFTVKTTPRGDIDTVMGFQTIMRSVLDSLPVSEESKLDVMQAMEQQFSDDAVKRMFEQTFNIFPGKPVALHDEWTKQTTTPANLLQDIETQNTYTLEQIEGNSVKLALKSDINTGSGDLFGMQTGTLVVDVPTGLVVHGVIRQNFKSKSAAQPIELTSTGTVTSLER